MYRLPFDKLNESNYHDWKFQMEAFLEEKGLFGVVSGEDTTSTDATAGETKSFLEKQRLARAKIVLAVEPSQIPHIRNVTDPAIVWKNLARIHRARGLGVLLTMRMEFLKMTMPPDCTIATWVAKVRHAAYCLEECHHAEEDSPNPTSSSIVSDLDKVGVLLNGLPSLYQTVIVSITGTPLSSLNFETVVTRLMNEEGHQRNLPTLLPVVMFTGYPWVKFSRPVPVPARDQTRKHGSGNPANTGTGIHGTHGSEQPVQV